MNPEKSDITTRKDTGRIKTLTTNQKLEQIQLCKGPDFGQDNLFAFDKGQK